MPAPDLSSAPESGAARFFNTAGPVVAEDHYCLPPLVRLDAGRVFELIGQKKYFILHAPRQTGKTSALLALRDELNATGRYRAVYTNVEDAQAAREDVLEAMRAILSGLGDAAEMALGDSFVRDHEQEALASGGPFGALRRILNAWSAADRRPLVLLVDEIDSLVGDTLLAVLRQLRAGYADRPARFPQSVILCGIRDVRDYRIHSTSEKAVITGGSAFNIKAESLRLGDFSERETDVLLSQHTDATGQEWAEAARREIFLATRGQPWLVNALAYEATREHRDRSEIIPVAAIHEARERLIHERVTHLDQLAHKLEEERVRRVVGPLLSGDPDAPAIRPDDLQYARDLGLIARDDPVRIANPIYQEVIPRDLTWTTQAFLPMESSRFVEDGELRVDRLLEAFQEFFREHSEHWVGRFDYREAGPQLLLQAFLQRAVNAGGRIEREYGLGRLRTDLLVIWPSGRGFHKTVIECKLLRGSFEATRERGLAQTREYMDRCGASAGHLVIFDRREGQTWEKKIRREEAPEAEAPVTVWGM